MSNKIICPRCFSQNFSLYGKDKDGYQKYICKNDDCKHQFTVDKPKKNRISNSLNVLYVVLLHTYIMITNIILDLLVILKNVTIILVLSNPLYF